MDNLKQGTIHALVTLFSLMVTSIVACVGPTTYPSDASGEVYPPPPQKVTPVTVGTLPPFPVVDPTSSTVNTPTGPDNTVVSSVYPAPGDFYPYPIEPLPGDSQMVRGNIFLEGKDLLILESFPPQFVLHLTGALPTPCHQLRAEVSGPDDQNEIKVEVFSITDPGKMCIQVLHPFEKDIPLGSFTSGKYPVLVNGEKVGEINP
jgi:hypothetical protein